MSKSKMPVAIEHIKGRKELGRCFTIETSINSLACLLLHFHLCMSLKTNEEHTARLGLLKVNVKRLENPFGYKVKQPPSGKSYTIDSPIELAQLLSVLFRSQEPPYDY